mmetsp:Transcript_12455/g.12496  ORF Transcript_12455/g.12496 Transcript_12455/m.12496 type:complete len:441 (-) Transcript_12455:51-1373(-)
MKNYDKDNIDYFTCKKIRKKIGELSSAQVSKVSLCASGFFNWLRAIVYYRVLRALNNNEPIPTRSIPQKEASKEETKSVVMPKEEDSSTDRVVKDNPSTWEDLFIFGPEEKHLGPNSLELVKESLDNFDIGLTIADITELKSLSRPPVVVTKVLNGVMAAFLVKTERGKTQYDWAHIKKFINQIGFLRNLIQFDADNNIDFIACKKIHSHIKDLHLGSVKCVSKCTAGFYMWLKKIVNQRVYQALTNEEPVPENTPKKKSPTKAISKPATAHITKPMRRAEAKEESKTDFKSWEDLFLFGPDEMKLNTENLEEVKTVIDEYQVEFNAKDIQLISSLACPPLAVSKVFTAVMEALGERDKSWKAIKSVIKRRNFEQSISEYDYDQTNVETLTKIHSQMSGLTEKKVKATSEASLSLFTWLKKVVNHRVHLALVSKEPLISC